MAQYWSPTSWLVGTGANPSFNQVREGVAPGPFTCPSQGQIWREKQPFTVAFILKVNLASYQPDSLNYTMFFGCGRKLERTTR